MGTSGSLRVSILSLLFSYYLTCYKSYYQFLESNKSNQNSNVYFYIFKKWT